MERTCECGRAIPPQRGPGKPRKRCTTCAPPRGRAAERAAVAVVPVPGPEPDGDWPTVVAIRKQLAGAGREAAPKGVMAIRLAAMLDEGGHTASGAAALTRQLCATLDEAMAGAPRAADGLDEIAERRARKAGA